MEKAKNTREMERPERMVGEQTLQDGSVKKPYKTPSLTKLGNVKELTSEYPGGLNDLFDESAG